MLVIDFTVCLMFMYIFLTLLDVGCSASVTTKTVEITITKTVEVQPTSTPSLDIVPDPSMLASCLLINEHVYTHVYIHVSL